MNQNLLQKGLELLKLAEELGDVKKACQIMSCSRDSYYRLKKIYDASGETGLQSTSRRKTPLVKNRVKEPVEQAVVNFTFHHPTWGQKRVADELARQQIYVSPGGVRSIWLRHNLETQDKRIEALAVKAAIDNLNLSRQQKKVLEIFKAGQALQSINEPVYPGYLAMQDTIFITKIKGLGRIYQQIFIDTYCQLAFIKLSTHNNPKVAASLVEEQVIPWYRRQGVRLLKILTTGSIVFCGSAEHHQYERLLLNNCIEHLSGKEGAAISKSLCQPFQETISEEFYRVRLARQTFISLSQFQKEVDSWLDYYNRERLCQSQACIGRTPFQTFLEDKHRAIEQVRIQKLGFRDKLGETVY